MLDRLFRILLRGLPAADYDEDDREEMWSTYRARVERAAGGGGRGPLRERAAEIWDLVRTLLWARSPMGFLDRFRQDLRQAVRSMRGSPLAALLAVASLALGIGATSAIYSALDVWLIQPLPVPNADRLIDVGMANRERGWRRNPFSERDWADWSEATQSVGLMGYTSGGGNFQADVQAERVSILRVTANALDVLGIEPILGRGFAAEEGTPAGPRVALLSYEFWERLGSDPGMVGRDVVLSGTRWTVVGILPADQGIPNHQVGAFGLDVWTPIRISANEPRAGHYLWGVGLLGDGVTLAAARAELDAVAARVVEQDPDRTFPNAFAQPFRDSVYGGDFEQAGALLASAALVVLLIACANIANILLARGLGRTHEMAVRGSLGADRGRLLAQLLVESALLATVGGVLGLAVGWVGIELLTSYVLPAGTGSWEEPLTLNGRVLASAGVMTVVATLAFGLLPALRTSKVDLRGRLADGGRDGGGSGRQRIASALVVGELAVTMALATNAALLIRSILETSSVDMGLRSEDALVFRLDVSQDVASGTGAIVAFYEELGERLGRLPGAEGFATSSGHPIRHWSTTWYSVTGAASSGPELQESAAYRRVTSSYLDVMRLSMVTGRWFDRALDVPGGAASAVVSRPLAERWWDKPSDALGQTVRMGEREATIVGVVDAGRMRGPQQESPPAIFEPFEQRPAQDAFSVFAHSMDDDEAVRTVRSAVAEMAPGLAVYQMSSIEASIDGATGSLSALLKLLGGLAALALTLTLAGVYGMVAHSVGRRRREMGLRMALGSDARAIVFLVLRGSTRIAAIGVGIGLLLSLGAGRLLASILEGVEPRDPWALGLVTFSLFLAVGVASYLPARRAASVDPVRTLRGE